MKLTNHFESGIYDINTYVMRGTIHMTTSEFNKAIKFLKKRYLKAKQNCDTYVRDSLYSVYSKEINTNRPFSVGVCATQLLAKEYKLNSYKNQNYGIRITNK